MANIDFLQNDAIALFRWGFHKKAVSVFYVRLVSINRAIVSAVSLERIDASSDTLITPSGGKSHVCH
jgi:hypothetical protein